MVDVVLEQRRDSHPCMQTRERRDSHPCMQTRELSAIIKMDA